MEVIFSRSPSVPHYTECVTLGKPKDIMVYICGVCGHILINGMIKIGHSK